MKRVPCTSLLPLDARRLVLQGAIGVDALDLDQSSGEHVQLLVVVVELADLAAHAGGLAMLDQRGGGLEVLVAARTPTDDFIVSWGGARSGVASP